MRTIRHSEPSDKKFRRELQPILADLMDPHWMDELRMIAAVTGRALIMVDAAASWEKVKDVLDQIAHSGTVGGTIGILVTDQDHPLATHPRLRTIDVRHEAGQITRSMTAGGALELSQAIAAEDQLVVAVHGAVGGAGTTVFAACIAQALHSTERETVIIDANPNSIGLDIALGCEQQPAMVSIEERLDGKYWRMCDKAPRIAKLPVGTGTVRGDRGGDREGGRELSGEGNSPDMPMGSKLLQRAALVLDCGTAMPSRTCGVVPNLHVVVAPCTVPGLMYAKRRCDLLAQHWGADPIVFVREVPRVEMPHSLVPVILQHYHVCWGKTHESVARSLEKGQPEEFLHDGHDIIHEADSVLARWALREASLELELRKAGFDDLELDVEGQHEEASRRATQGMPC